MMRMHQSFGLRYFLLAGALCPVVGLSSAMAAEPVTKVSQDWQVVCDNTNTCRMVGYQDESNAGLPVSVLLTRRGDASKVAGEVNLGGSKSNTAKALAQLGNRHKATMYIDGRSYGEVSNINSETGTAALSNRQIQALLDNLTRSSQIEFVIRNTQWQLSDAGATFVMNAADEAQGKANTPEALVKKGNEPAASQASSLPTLTAAKVASTAPVGKRFTMSAQDIATLLAPTVSDIDKNCPQLSDNQGWLTYRLNDSTILAQHRCWNNSYDTGDGIWVLNDTEPYQPKLITTSASRYENGVITSELKQSVLGDCINKEEWLWTKEGFQLSHKSTTGLCRNFDKGGAWQLPIFLADVITE